MTVKCGRGNHYHRSAAAVRECYNGGDPIVVDRNGEVMGLVTESAAGRAPEPEFIPPTDAQMMYVKDLLDRDRLVWVAGLRNLAKRHVSEVISALTNRRAADDPRFRKVDRPAYCRKSDCWDRAEVVAKTAGARPRTHYFCAEHGDAAKRMDSRIWVEPLEETAETRRADVRATAPGFEQADIPGLGKVPIQKRDDFDPQSLADGFYALPDPEGAQLPVVYKVIVAVHGSGRKYAKRLNTDTGEWDIARGAIRLLRPEHKMTLEQALAVAKVVANDVQGELYGRCFVCGRTLTNEDSIERFMGPVCAEKFA